MVRAVPRHHLFPSDGPEAPEERDRATNDEVRRPDHGPLALVSPDLFAAGEKIARRCETRREIGREERVFDVHDGPRDSVFETKVQRT